MLLLTLYSKLMDWNFSLLRSGHGNLLYEHMECEQLILANIFPTIQVSSVFSFSDAFYIDLLFKRIYIWTIRCFQFGIPTQSNCVGSNRPSSFNRFKCVVETHIKPGGESLLGKRIRLGD